jgi:hypothetical protein
MNTGAMHSVVGWLLKPEAKLDRPCSQALIADGFAKRDFKKVRPHCCALARIKVAQHTIGLANKIGLI